MRTIKFRGKYIDDSWTYGNLEDGGITQLIAEYFIDRETIGQYIGRKDRNGKEVYEGDILLSSCGEIKYLISYKDEWAAFRIADVKDLNEDRWSVWMPIKTDWWKKYTPTIIGNKFDNPELLKDYEKE